MTAAVEATSLTSVFLDECLHMFFGRFIPTFPVLHRGTFVFRDCTQPLLLNAMAIGSLYLGPKNSIAKVGTIESQPCWNANVHQGEALWRLAHIAVTTSVSWASRTHCLQNSKLTSIVGNIDYTSWPIRCMPGSATSGYGPFSTGLWSTFESKWIGSVY